MSTQVAVDFMALLASEDNTAKQAVLAMLQAELAAKNSDDVTVVTPITADEVVATAPDRSGIVLQAARTRAAVREALALKSEDAAPAMPALVVPPAVKSAPIAGNAADYAARKVQGIAAVDIGSLNIPKRELTEKQKKSALKGARWTDVLKKAEACYVCMNARDEDQRPEDKLIRPGMRYVYWPIVRHGDAGTVEYLFFHGPCWEANPQFDAANMQAHGSASILRDPNPIVAMSVAEAKAKEKASLNQAHHGTPDPSKLPGGLPRGRTPEQIREDVESERKRLRPVTGAERAANNLDHYKRIAAEYGYDVLSDEAMDVVEAYLARERRLNSLTLMPIRPSAD